MERTTVENLKELIRAGRAKTPATKVIMGGTLVNVMSEEIYPADIAVYKDTIVAVGDVKEYIGEETEVIDAKGTFAAENWRGTGAYLRPERQYSDLLRERHCQRNPAGYCRKASSGRYP